MLVGQSTAEYVLVQFIIYTNSYLGLICLTYFLFAASVGGIIWISHPVSIVIEVIGAIEILFYLFWFLPYRYYLHKQPAQFSTPLSREQRQELFYKILSVTPDIELFARKWMCWGSMEDLRRENLKEWMLWALFDREGSPGDDDEELEEYVDSVEEVLGRNIKPGWGPAKYIRMNFDKFTVTHRTLLYYIIIGIIDFIASMVLIFSGFIFYRQPRSKFFSSFPFRPMTLLGLKKSASPNMSYFYRPHKSTKHHPLVLIHGIGIGLAIYVPLMLMLPKDVGILAIEILPVSSRITSSLPLAIDQMREIGDIISQQDLKDFVFAGNSYGSFFARIFLDSSYLESRMAKMVLFDPVSVLLHVPDLAYNFTKKPPVEANEVQLWWAAQTEPDIAFNLARRFCWRDHLIWREDLLSRPTTLIIGEKDCLVDANAIAAYITKGDPVPNASSIDLKPDLQWSWRDIEKWKRSYEDWKGEGLELVWLEGCDHGQGSLYPSRLPQVVSVIERTCERDRGASTMSSDIEGAGDHQNTEPDVEMAEKAEMRRSEVIEASLTQN